MIILTGTDGTWETDTGSIRGLENILQVHTTRNLLDQDGRQSLCTKLFVHAQIVDLNHFLVAKCKFWSEQTRKLTSKVLLVINPNVGGNCRDKAHKLLVGRHPHADVP